MIVAPARRKGAFTVAALAGAVAGCTVLTGAGDLGVTNGCMDCGDGGTPPSDAPGAEPPLSDGGLRWRDAAHEGPPACDETSDPSCLALPGGWALVAAIDVAGAKSTECPAGFDGSKDGKIDVGEAPAAKSDTCSCDGCKVTEPATCAGPVTHHFGTECATEGPASAYTNDPPNTCGLLMYLGVYSADQRFTLSPASGGACAADPPVLHASRVAWAKRTRLCAEVARCSGGVCDVRLDPPFSACVAHGGELPCPDAFPQRSIVSEKATFDCSGTCGCSVTRSCAGTISHYSDTACTTGEVSVPADGICRTTALGGKNFGSYKVKANPTTTCTANGAGTASNARLVSPITLCCR